MCCALWCHVGIRRPQYILLDVHSWVSGTVQAMKKNAERKHRQSIHQDTVTGRHRGWLRQERTCRKQEEEDQPGPGPGEKAEDRSCC